MEVNVFGLKCDNKECNYEDKTIKYEQYEDYINYPCPQCGESLLTKTDYLTTKFIVEAANIFNGLGLENSESDKDDKVKIKFDLNGSGVSDITVEGLEEDK